MLPVLLLFVVVVNEFKHANITLPIKTRLAERKIEMQEMRKEKHTVTSKKYDKKCFETKSDKDLESKSLSESGDLKC